MDHKPVFDGPSAPEGDAFYAPLPELPHGTFGDPIFLRPLDNPEAVLTHGQNWLVLYRSEAADGEPIAVSGIIALPNDPPRDGQGYPIVTFAHGTVGVCPTCGPSRDYVGSSAHPMNKYPQRLLNGFLDQGWAVAMTDYEGLGVEGRRHPYLLGKSEAHGVLDIVETTRRLFGEYVGEQYAIMGHSQGGQAALFAAHHGGRVPGLVGVAAMAPANHPYGIVRAGSLLPATDGGFAFTPLFLSGAVVGDTTIDVDKVLSDTALLVWPDVLTRCRAGLSDSDSWGGLLGIQQFRSTLLNPYPAKPNAEQTKFEDQLRLMNPDLPISVPIRISQSADDQRVKTETTEVQLPGFTISVRGVDALAEEELPVTNPDNPPLYVRYERGEVMVPNPDPDNLGAHFAMLDYDRNAVTTWLAERFAG
ncbi:alpha/beta hydrolase family protein [Nocardia sp. NPDC051570]|uniref:alpha/beta hydrolase family protein n=1 Tax=Nocardia sp. NPDC051570 TaxID=3364324 RepID=UPI0037AF8F68